MCQIPIFYAFFSGSPLLMPFKNMPFKGTVSGTKKSNYVPQHRGGEHIDFDVLSTVMANLRHWFDAFLSTISCEILAGLLPNFLGYVIGTY